MLTSSAVAPIARAIRWPSFLSIWAVFAVRATGIWRLVRRDSAVRSQTGVRVATVCLCLGVAPAFFIGSGTSAYARMLAWLPPLSVQPGWSATATGRLLAGLTLAQVVVPVRLRRRWRVVRARVRSSS